MSNVSFLCFSLMVALWGRVEDVTGDKTLDTYNITMTTDQAGRSLQVAGVSSGGHGQEGHGDCRPGQEYDCRMFGQPPMVQSTFVRAGIACQLW